MKENTDEKSLVKINENSMFFKIKKFFKKFFSKNEPLVTAVSAEVNNTIRPDEDKRNTFMEEIKKIEDEETILLKLQKKYRIGEIKEDELTEEQVYSLCKLYDKQIATLKKSNENLKKSLIKYRKNSQKNN